MRAGPPVVCPPMAPLITVLLDLPPDNRHHAATLAALRHAIDHTRQAIDVRAVRTDALHRLLEGDQPPDGVVIGPGTPYADPASAEAVVRSARERGVPLLAT